MPYQNRIGELREQLSDFSSKHAAQNAICEEMLRLRDGYLSLYHELRGHSIFCFFMHNYNYMTQEERQLRFTKWLNYFDQHGVEMSSSDRGNQLHTAQRITVTADTRFRIRFRHLRHDHPAARDASRRNVRDIFGGSVADLVAFRIARELDDPVAERIEFDAGSSDVESRRGVRLRHHGAFDHARTIAKLLLREVLGRRRISATVELSAICFISSIGRDGSMTPSVARRTRCRASGGRCSPRGVRRASRSRGDHDRPGDAEAARVDHRLASMSDDVGQRGVRRGMPVGRIERAVDLWHRVPDGAVRHVENFAVSGLGAPAGAARGKRERPSRERKMERRRPGAETNGAAAERAAMRACYGRFASLSPRRMRAGGGDCKEAVREAVEREGVEREGVER